MTADGRDKREGGKRGGMKRGKNGRAERREVDSVQSREMNDSIPHFGHPLAVTSFCLSDPQEVAVLPEEAAGGGIIVIIQLVVATGQVTFIIASFSFLR